MRASLPFVFLGVAIGAGVASLGRHEVVLCLRASAQTQEELAARLTI